MNQEKRKEKSRNKVNKWRK